MIHTQTMQYHCGLSKESPVFVTISGDSLVYYMEVVNGTDMIASTII
jgi:hypothetical protein